MQRVEKSFCCFVYIDTIWAISFLNIQDKILGYHYIEIKSNRKKGGKITVRRTHSTYQIKVSRTF